MLMFQVDYSILDKELYQKEGSRPPKYVVAKSFNLALNKARQYESSNLLLLEMKLLHSDGDIVFAPVEQVEPEGETVSE